MSNDMAVKQMQAKPMIMKISALTAALVCALVAVAFLFDLALLLPTLIIAGLLWPSLAAGLWWIVRANEHGHWPTVQAWFLASGLRVVACLLAVVVSVKALSCDPMLTVACLAVLYLPTLFLETALVVGQLKRGRDDVNIPARSVRTEALSQ